MASLEVHHVNTVPRQFRQKRSDHRGLKRWTASVTCVFSPNVRNSDLAVNPLALTIVRSRAD
jgi:hypothetical protein